MPKVDLSLYALADPAVGDPDDLPAATRAAAEGGASLVQLRDKAGTGRRMVALARALKAALEGTGVPLLINDRVDVALAAGADGVHLGQEDMGVADARRLLGEDAIIGLTVRSDEEADAVPEGVVDYVCIGGVFATTSKDNPSAPIGLDGLSRIAGRVRKRHPALPAGAIAGIHAGNAAEVIGAGADGIAVISAIFTADDPKEAARRLRSTVDRALSVRGA